MEIVGKLVGELILLMLSVFAFAATVAPVWNRVVKPETLGLKRITFKQAVGIFLLLGLFQAFIKIVAAL